MVMKMRGKILTDETTGRQYKEVKVRCAYPLWAAAAVWLIGGLFVPMYGIVQLLILAAVSVIAALLTARFTPAETKRVELPFLSGSAELDVLVRELDTSHDRIAAAGARVEKERPETAARIRSITKTVTGIRDCIVHDPEDAKAARRFLNYYLPTTVKLTETYADTVLRRTDSENAADTERAIEGALVSVDESFHRQYDALFANDRLDITSDITVLETMLKRDNLA